MNRTIQQEFEVHHSFLDSLCRKLGVKRLRLFGSAVSTDFDEINSDLDLIVEFYKDTEPGIADRFMALAVELELLFNRPVDLLTERSVKNPVFRSTIESSGLIVYEA